MHCSVCISSNSPFKYPRVAIELITLSPKPNCTLQWESTECQLFQQVSSWHQSAQVQKPPDSSPRDTRCNKRAGGAYSPLTSRKIQFEGTGTGAVIEDEEIFCNQQQMMQEREAKGLGTASTANPFGEEAVHEESSEMLVVPTEAIPQPK